MSEKLRNEVDEETFKRVFAVAIIHISYCEMYPDSPICEDDPLACDDCDPGPLDEPICDVDYDPVCEEVGEA